MNYSDFVARVIAGSLMAEARDAIRRYAEMHARYEPESVELDDCTRIRRGTKMNPRCVYGAVLWDCRDMGHLYAPIE